MARVQQVQLLLIADLHPPADGGSSSESIIVGASNLSQWWLLLTCTSVSVLFGMNVGIQSRL